MPVRFRYNKLWKILIDRKMKKNCFRWAVWASNIASNPKQHMPN